jgi:hypothetical protein
LLKRGGSFESLAATSELRHHLDILQMTFDEGPCCRDCRSSLTPPIDQLIDLAQRVIETQG